MDKCKHCETLIESIPGRRVKEFCGNNCRAKFWQKNNPKKKEFHPIETPIKHIPPSKREVVEQVVKDFTKPTNEVKPKEQPKTNYTIKTTSKNEQPEPKEGSMAFYSKYGVATYAEIKKQ